MYVFEDGTSFVQGDEGKNDADGKKEKPKEHILTSSPERKAFSILSPPNPSPAKAKA